MGRQEHYHTVLACFDSTSLNAKLLHFSLGPKLRIATASELSQTSGSVKTCSRLSHALLSELTLLTACSSRGSPFKQKKRESAPTPLCPPSLNLGWNKPENIYAKRSPPLTQNNLIFPRSYCVFHSPPSLHFLPHFYTLACQYSGLGGRFRFWISKTLF